MPCTGSSSFPVSLPHAPPSAPWNQLPNKLLGEPNLKQQKKLSERLADKNEDSKRKMKTQTGGHEISSLGDTDPIN